MPIYALVLTSPPVAPSLSDFAAQRAWELIPAQQQRTQSWLAPREAWQAEFATNEVGAAARIREEVAIQLHGVTLDVNVVIATPETRRKRLLVADMDSTIIEQECIDEIADFAGVKQQVAAITERAMRGELDFESALRTRVGLLRGLSQSILERVISERIKIMSGARTLVQTMRHHGATTALVSGGFTFFTSRIASAVGFDLNQANTLEIDDGKLTGTVAEPILGREAKFMALDRLAREQGLAPEATMAVGDGANDLQMIEAAGLGVAYHAKPIVADAADAAIRYGDLTSLLYLQGYRKDEFVVA